MTSTLSLLHQQIETEIGPHSQVPVECRPELVQRFLRDLESEAYRILLTEEEREQVRALLTQPTV